MRNIVKYFFIVVLFVSAKRTDTPKPEVMGFPYDTEVFDPFEELRNMGPKEYRKEVWKFPMYATYFVTTTGNSGNTGLSEGSAWNFAHALTQVNPGDIVNVKAGNYGSLQLSFTKSGNSSNPIIFRGYATTPGDVVPEARSTIKNRNGLSASLMPYFQRSWLSNTTAFTISGDYNHISNMQVEGFEIAFNLQSTAEFNLLDNVITKEQGNMSVATGDSSNPDRYKGEGFRVSGSNNEIRNYALFNPAQQGIAMVGGDFNLIRDGNLESYDQNNGIDYFCLTTSGATYNIFDNNFLNRTPGISHNGHGFVAKGSNVEYNIYRNSEVLNTSVCEVNSQGVRFNLFQNLKSTGSWDTFGSGGDEYGFIYIFNGANNNRFDRVWVDNSWNFVMFFDNGETTTSNVVNSVAAGGIARNAGNNNWFTNCIGTRSGNAIYINPQNRAVSPTYDNHFIGCSFVGMTSSFFRPLAANSGFDLRNILIHNSPNGILGGSGYTLNTPSMSHLNKSGTGFPASNLTGFGATNVTTVNPSFQNYGTFDLRITNNNLDIGTAVADPNFTIDGVVYTTIGNDFSGNARTGARTIGAYEFSGTPTGPTCFDGIQNGTETGIDCGGGCEPCDTALTQSPIQSFLNIFYDN